MTDCEHYPTSLINYLLKYIVTFWSHGSNIYEVKEIFLKVIQKLI